MRLLSALGTAAALLLAGTATADPIVPTNGEAFLLAYQGGGSSAYEFRSTYPPGDVFPGSSTTPTGPLNLSGDTVGPVAVGTDGGSASTTFSHVATNTLVSITGSTAAASTAGQFVAQSAGDDTGVIDSGLQLGYYIEFTLTQDSLVRLTVDGTTSTSDEPGVYADFGGRLIRVNDDGSITILNQLGLTDEDGVITDDTGTLEFLLGAGNYALFAQSQSSVLNGGSASADFTASIEILAPAVIPEPLSVMAFGGLLAAGGVVAFRRRKASI